METADGELSIELVGIAFIVETNSVTVTGAAVTVTGVGALTEAAVLSTSERYAVSVTVATAVTVTVD